MESSFIGCKICQVDNSTNIDYYICDECGSVVCHSCMYTSSRSGRDFCVYCKDKL